MSGPSPHPGLLDVALVGGIGLVSGVLVLGSQDIGVSGGAAAAGVGSQIGLTGPAAIVMLAAAVWNLLLGALLVRAIRGVPFGSVGEALVWGLAGAVLVDLLLLATLGTLGWFDQPLLLAIGGLGVLAGVIALSPIVVRSDEGSPSVEPQERSRWATLGRLAWWTLVVAVWAIPVVVQLTSPVVAIQDVLPNHVAPVEYLRAYGTFPNLDIVPAPNYGPSRQLLGYVALLGTLAKATNLGAALAASAFVGPLTVLVAVAGVRFARGLFGGAGTWALLTLPLTFTFTRLPDARGSVLAAPLLFLALSPDESLRPIRRESLTAVALASAVYVHPLLGAMGVVACVAIAIWRRNDVGVAGAVGAVMLSLPQVVTMAGVSLPSWILLVAVPPALGAISVTLRASPHLVRFGRWTMLPLALAALAQLGGVADELAGFAGHLIRSYPTLTLGSCACLAVVAARRARAPLLIPLGVAAIFAVGGSLLPDTSTFYQGIKAEIGGKALQYWAPLFLAVGAGGALGAVWERAHRAMWARLAMVGLVGFLIFPVGSNQTDFFENEERRISEQLSIALDRAERGAWVNWPDPRFVVDEAGGELLDAVASEQRSGRLGQRDHVLRVSAGYQSWESTPVAPFTGAMETSVSLNPDRSPHALEGRLRHLSTLPRLLRAGYEYVLLEEEGLGPEIRRRIIRARYRPLFFNERGELLRRAG